VNSEELEQSLRTEFESYLKNVLADMRQEVADFQKQFEAEFEKHKTQIDEVFQSFSSRFAAERDLDASFTESVVEHLRLSRDEGARITAMAIAEAEELDKQNAAEAQAAEPAAPAFSFGEIREAINDISTKTTQSAILKTLVNHAAQFTPRGAFFIIKNEHLVGWRVFGKDGETVDEQTVREVFFPVAASTALGEAVRSLSAVESAYGVYSDDSIYLNKLEFGQPEQMFAVPLVVRGRTVAVLYADRGAGDGEVNIDALESLVRVASMTVEILASSRSAQTPNEPAEEASAAYGNFEAPAAEPETVQSESSVEESYQTPPANAYQFAQETEASAPIAEENMPVAEAEAEPEQVNYSYEQPVENDYSYKAVEQPAETYESPNYQTSVEGDGFSFAPSVEAETTEERFVSETSEVPGDEVSNQEFSPAAEYQTASEEAQSFETTPSWNQKVETDDYYSKDSAISYETPSYETESATYEISEPQTFETEAPAAENNYAASLNGNEGGGEYQVETNQSYETPSVEFEQTAPQTFETPAYEEPQYEAPQYEVESFTPSNGTSYDSGGLTENGKAQSYAVETPVEAPVETVASEAPVKQPSKSRFSERNVDLPIEVSEDERRLHNDARRFARLLVSEIKLYNEQKVKEGREGNDLYERLREAIDRSREMYDKRVQPPVAAKFDYFHYELVSNLAEGDSSKLGTTYPGSSV
jgi:hypothetical protein